MLPSSTEPPQGNSPIGVLIYHIRTNAHTMVKMTLLYSAWLQHSLFHPHPPLLHSALYLVRLLFDPENKRKSPLIESPIHPCVPPSSSCPNVTWIRRSNWNQSSQVMPNQIKPQQTSPPLFYLLVRQQEYITVSSPRPHSPSQSSPQPPPSTFVSP